MSTKTKLKSQAFTSINLKVLYLFAFLEGFLVLLFELFGGKIITAYYGNAYYVLTSVLGVSMLGLGIGYLIGGNWSFSKNLKNKVSISFLWSAFFLSFSAAFSNSIFKITSSFEIQTGIFLSTSLILLPGLIFLGSTGSMLIQLLSDNNQDVGKASGKVFALSSLGGFISSFIFGFIALPIIGISWSLILISFLILALTYYFHFKTSPEKKFWMVTSLVILFSIFVASNTKEKKSKSFYLAYQSEGVMGQIKVLDFTPLSSNLSYRRLLINGIPQTYITNNKDAFSIWRYPHFMSAFATLKKTHSKVLLVGLGGGSVAKELKNLGFQFDIVEIDKRMPEVVNNYFYLSTKDYKIFNMDARVFFRDNKKKYDLILFDVLTGETQPSYVFTMESIEQIKKSLDENGVMVVNFQGIVNDKKDQAFPSLNKTFQRSGFFTYYWATEPNAFEDIIFVLSQQKINFASIDSSRLNVCCKMTPMMKNFLKSPAICDSNRFKEVDVFTDDKPNLDKLNRNAIMQWRKNMLGEITNEQLKENLSIYK